jgi:regulatory protein
MRLYRQTLEDFALYSGAELTDEQYTKMCQHAGAISAKMRAVRIVSASSVSKKDLQQRLIQKGESPKDAENAVKWMSDMDLVDDRKTAEQIVNRCIAKGYGISRAKQALYEKRIPKEYWTEALEEYPDQTEAIGAYLESKLNGDSDQKEIKRAIDALIRRGHSYSQIRRALDRLSLETEEFTED